MPFAVDDKHVIKVLRLEKRYSSRRFLKEFPNKNWTCSGLDNLIKKIDSSGSIERPPGSGCVRTVRNDKVVEEVAELVQSQEEQPHSHLSLRQISRGTGISRSSIHRVIKTDLELKCFKREHTQVTGADSST